MAAGSSTYLEVYGERKLNYCVRIRRVPDIERSFGPSESKNRPVFSKGPEAMQLPIALGRHVQTLPGNWSKAL